MSQYRVLKHVRYVRLVPEHGAFAVLDKNEYNARDSMHIDISRETQPFGFYPTRGDRLDLTNDDMPVAVCYCKYGRPMLITRESLKKKDYFEEITEETDIEPGLN